jgi:hypothetical protein
MLRIKLGEIIKASWYYTWGNKKLWLIALLVAFGGFFWQYNYQDWSTLSASWQIIGQGGHVSAGVWALLIAIISVIGLALFLLSLWFRASLIFGIDKIRQLQNYKLKELLHLGRKKIGALFIIEILVGLANFALFIPTIILALAHSSALNVVLWITMALTIVFNIIIFLFISYSYFYAVLDDKKAVEAMKLAWGLFVKNWKEVLLATLVEVALLVAMGLAMIMVLLILAIPLAIIGVLLLMVAGSNAIAIMSIVGAAILLVLFALLRGGVNVFLHSYLMNVYWRLKE